MYAKVLLIAITSVLISLAVFTADAAPLPDVDEADRLFAEKSYKPALKLYREAYDREAGQSDGRGHAMLRVARCLRRLGEFDRAIGFLDTSLPGFDGTIWHGRAMGLRGTIALTMPHYYYEKGDRISRTEWIQGATYHYTYYDDLISAMKDLEEAVKLLERTPLVKSISDEERERRSDDFTQVCVDMATALEAHRGQKGGLVGLEPHSEVVADHAKHSIGRHFGVDPQAYFKLASQSAKSVGRSEDVALADYLEAMYCRRLLAQFRVVAKVGEDGTFEIHCRIGGSDEKPELVKLPAASDPFRLFEAFAGNHPTSRLLDDVVYSHAVTCNEFERYVEAIELMKDFSKRFGKSPWRSDVANLVQQITHPVIELQSPPAVLPGEPQEVTITTRNVSKLEIDVHRLDFDRVFGSRDFLDEDEASLADVESIVKAVGLRRIRTGDAVLSLTPSTGDAGKHRRHEQVVRMDLPGPGAYLIEARGPETTMRTLALVSNLAVIRKVSDEETIVVVTDATTGQPIENASVTVRQKHRAKGLFGDYDKVTWDDGKTDAKGVFIRRHADSSARQIHIEAFASNGSHPAITRFGNAYPNSAARDRLVLYGFTDRPVYRPTEETHFVGSLRTSREGGYVNWSGNRIDVTIRDPKNSIIFNERLETDDFGAVSGRIVLGDEPPLGVYNIQYRDGKRHVGRTTFRVEEYKKPEFEITVEGPEDPVRVGDEIAVRIVGEYYFGGGVDGAAVRYRVHRRRFMPQFRIDEPYAWLYGRRRGMYERSYGQELLLQGERTTDGDGVLRVSVPTADLRDRLPDEDHELIVEADVTDLSRRTISGSGTVIVPRRGLFARLDADRGFYRAGEHATLAIRTQTASGSPAPSTGSIVVSRVTTRREGEEVKETLTQISAEEFATPENGMKEFSWHPDSAGRFAVRYVTTDRWGEPVVGETRLWVTAPDYRAQDFQAKNIDVVTDKSEYQPGETAFVLVNSAFEDTAVFITLEAERQVLFHDVILLTGRTRVLTIPIRKEFAPNVHVHAMCARNGQFYEHVQEMFVPPTQDFMNVDLAFDQAEYLPGSDAKLSVTCTDRNGRPLDAQLALRVMDESITYIQPDMTPDIRKFFYGDKRSFFGGGQWNANTLNSLQFAFQGYLARNRDWKNYRNHGMPNGWHLDLSQSWGESGLKNDGGFLGLDAEESAEGNDDLGESLYEAKSKVAGRARGMRSLDSKRATLGAPAPSESVAQGDESNDLVEPELRENFSTLANWIPALRTGDDGVAEVSFRFPDSLTNWIATARGMTRETIVGEGETEARTTKRVLARLQAPRFFTERDEIVLSGVIRNDYDVDLPMKVELAIDGDALRLVGDATKSMTVRAGEQLRVDWTARVVASGDVGIKLSALSSRESDAMSMRFPVLAYGIDKVVTHVRMSTSDDEIIEIPVELPEQRRLSSTALEVTLSPSLASTMLDALPYLVEYPYGCTEQTTSRFLPAVMVAKTLREMGISLEDISAKRVDLANRADLNARGLEPIYHSGRLEQIVKAGIRRLASMQNSDGGFGWWARDRSSLHLSSYVIHGLAEARSAGFDVPAHILDRGIRYLESEVEETRSVPEIGFAAFALAVAGKKHAKALDHVYAKRDELETLSKAQLALALHLTGDAERARVVVRNLADFAQHDRDNGTCHWPGGRTWWRWYADEVETNAWVLLAFSKIDPKNEANEPLSRWLVNNRSGNRWKSTRDTAACVLALCEYMRGADELSPDYTASLSYADLPATERRVNRDNMFAFDNRIVLRGDALRTGSIPLRVHKRGAGKLYVTTRLIYFSQEDKITASGHEIEVSRRYYRLEPYETTEKRGDRDVKVIKYERTLLEDLASIPAGAEVEVVMNVTARNDYEYIMVEDRKPAGFEPVELRSGSRYGNGLCSNMELRDERVVFFVSWLQQGTHEISYRMRAESPGKLNAMPCKAVAMYAPRLGGISDSWRVQVVDSAN